MKTVLTKRLLPCRFNELNPFYDDIGELTDLPPIFRDQIEHFFRHYKDLERGKWVKLTGWADREKARALIMQAISRFKPA